MDKKRSKNQPNDEIKGFEEFIEGQPGDTSFLGKQGQMGNKKEVSFEHFTFLVNDAERLNKLKNLLKEKLPFAMKFEQGNHLLAEQRREVTLLKQHLFEHCDKNDSSYRKSIREIFDSFFEPPKN